VGARGEYRRQQHGIGTGTLRSTEFSQGMGGCEAQQVAPSPEPSRRSVDAVRTPAPRGVGWPRQDHEMSMQSRQPRQRTEAGAALGRIEMIMPEDETRAARQAP